MNHNIFVEKNIEKLRFDWIEIYGHYGIDIQY